jgi:hypothetical protein
MAVAINLPRCLSRFLGDDVVEREQSTDQMNIGFHRLERLERLGLEQHLMEMQPRVYAIMSRPIPNGATSVRSCGDLSRTLSMAGTTSEFGLHET